MVIIFCFLCCQDYCLSLASCSFSCVSSFQYFCFLLSPFVFLILGSLLLASFFLFSASFVGLCVVIRVCCSPPFVLGIHSPTFFLCFPRDFFRFLLIFFFIPFSCFIFSLVLSLLLLSLVCLLPLHLILLFFKLLSVL